MQYRINAIQTLYKGILFRSRLEAKWACMFDLLGWKWEYEPVDFAGWCPDFVIREAQTVYVEVKPCFTFPDEVAKQIDASGCKDEVLILGACLDYNENMVSHTLGWLREGASWGEAQMGRWHGSKRVGFCHSDLSFADRISGGYDGGSWGGSGYPVEVVERHWRSAGNITQWNPYHKPLSPPLHPPLDAP